MKNIILAIVLTSGLFLAPIVRSADERIDLSVGNFRPLEAETSKFLTPIARTTLGAGTTDLSAEDRQFLAPEEMGRIRKEEIREKIVERIKQAEAVEAENAKREEDIERLRQSMLGQPEMRPLFDASKKLIAKISQYNVFRVLERNDMAELLQEARAESSDKAKGVFANARLAWAHL
jgi:hypothetical protein